VRDIYNIEPIRYPFEILPTYYSFIDETSFRGPEGDVVGKDLLGTIWAAYLNCAYWAQEALRSIKGLITHNANHNFIAFNYPLYIHNTTLRLEGVTRVGDLPGSRGDINVVPNGDIRIRAVNDSTVYTDKTTAGIWGWYKGCNVPASVTISGPWPSTHQTSVGITDEDLFDLPSYRVRNDNIYMIVPYRHDNTAICGNSVGITFEVTRGDLEAELSVKAFANFLSSNVEDDQTVQLDIGIIYYKADGSFINLDDLYFVFDTTEKECYEKINVREDTRVITIILYPQDVQIDGTSYDYNLWVSNVSIKDGNKPYHLDKYDDNFVLDKPMLESKIYEVEILNPMLFKYWDYILGSNILNFTALSSDDYTWKESVATNMKMLWRPMVENSIYNLIRGCASVAYSWFAPETGQIERLYPSSDNRIWDGSLIKLTTDSTTYYRYSVLSPIYTRNQGIGAHDLVNDTAINIIAPESAHIYTRIWSLNDETIYNIAGKDDLSYTLRLKPHKFILFQYNDMFNLQSERFYEMLKYGQRASPPGYKFLITPGTVSETVYWTLAFTFPPLSYNWDTTVNDIFVVSPATITTSWIVGISHTDTTKYVVAKATLYNNDDELLFTNEETYYFDQTDYNELFLITVDLTIDAGNNQHIPYNGYLVVELNTYPATGLNRTFIWEGPLIGIRREYWGNHQIRLWDLSN